MHNEKDTVAFYKKLKKSLKKDTQWPALYLYKFIIPTNESKIAEIEAIFNNTNAEITKRDSSKGTYTSISIKVNMKSPDAVIEKYKKVSKVEGVISL
jgi:putative lipoic acid-binding regulatory protein